jgi:hypothetical protein
MHTLLPWAFLKLLVLFPLSVPEREARGVRLRNSKSPRFVLMGDGGGIEIHAINTAPLFCHPWMERNSA